MSSNICERAIEDAISHKKAILKLISSNDVGATGAHQYGFYLPKEVWHLFTPNKPEKGTLNRSNVTIRWQNGLLTNSNVIWYGQKTRSEYRLTRFGRDFPYLIEDNVGSLLVLIPITLSQFNAYILNNDDDIEDIQASLGVELLGNWASYEEGKLIEFTEDECINSKFIEFVNQIDFFPAGDIFSKATLDTLLSCKKDFSIITSDEQLISLINQEYQLFKRVERKLSGPLVNKSFAEIDDFLKTALTILQRRKARAGRSLENHVEYLLKMANIPHQMRPKVDKTEPDIIIPDKESYDDPHYPDEKLFILALKMTCKDRWRQVISEAPRIKQKHILTMQKGISSRQLEEMERASVSLVIPKKLHIEYPSSIRDSLITIDDFFNFVRESLIQE
ncbi:MAG: hypothetical protein JW704_03865 [Anaerolineaceae bacterium]|nr:hypothetical protein [Anaerolineaceae bacterium]MBN2678121.1 hypothetical protein [Anaerolineaceae bacterium]